MKKPNSVITIAHYDGYSIIYAEELPVGEMKGVQRTIEAHHGGEVFVDFELSAQMDCFFIAGTEEGLENLREEANDE